MSSQLNYYLVAQRTAELARAGERAHLEHGARERRERGRLSRMVRRVRLRLVGSQTGDRAGHAFPDAVADAPQTRG